MHRRVRRETIMTIETLVSEVTPPLRPGDTVEHAIGLLLECRVLHLPVVTEEGNLIGVVSENQLLDASGPDALVESLIGFEPISVHPRTHIFDATKVIVDHNLTTLALADETGQFVGLVKRHNIFDQFARMLSTQESGAIIALEVDQRDYSLAQLAYHIEQNDVKILSTATEHPSVSENSLADGRIRVTLKLNVHDTARVRHILEHYGYRVVACFSEELDDEDFKNRLQEFMRYLEV